MQNLILLRAMVIATIILRDLLIARHDIPCNSACNLCRNEIARQITQCDIHFFDFEERNALNKIKSNDCGNAAKHFNCIAQCNKSLATSLAIMCLPIGFRLSILHQTLYSTRGFYTMIIASCSCIGHTAWFNIQSQVVFLNIARQVAQCQRNEC